MMADSKINDDDNGSFIHNYGLNTLNVNTHGQLHVILSLVEDGKAKESIDKILHSESGSSIYGTLTEHLVLDGVWRTATNINETTTFQSQSANC